MMNKKYELIKEKVYRHKNALQYIFFEGKEIDNIIDIVEFYDKYIIIFTGGDRVIYTLNSITAEVCFKKYLIWLNNNINMLNKMYCKRSLEYVDGNFIEYIYYDKSSHYKMEYYHSLGQLIAIANTIGCSLMIPEDIAEKNEMPIIIDISKKLQNKIVQYNIPYFEYKNFIKMSTVEIDHVRGGYQEIEKFINKNIGDVKRAIDLLFKEYNDEIE